MLGASGSGKSSVVLAGLVPKLEKEGHWKFTHFRPGSDPFHALALALVPLYRPELDATDEIIQARKLAKYLSNDRDSEDNLPLSDVFAKIKQNNPNHWILLIADQFEELYTQCSDSTVRRRFLDCLLTSFQSSNSGGSSSTVLVITMRADFLANALSYRPFADMLQNADIKLGAMSREELTEVIEKPAEKLGVTFEAGLVERILNDVENEPGNLPLLEFALTELWKKRTGRQLTHDSYEAIGQVKGALADYADDKYRNLTKEEQQQARRIFIQLVRPGEGTEDTRRRANRTELGDEHWDLITRKDGLAHSRLVVTGCNDSEQETVEVVHEALIQNWGQLREWMEIDRKFRVWQELLRVEINQWKDVKKDEGGLLRGAPLVQAEDWQNKRLVDLSQGEQEFIKLSLELQKREKKERELIKRRIILGLTSFSGVALILALVAGLGWQSSERQRQIVFARQLAAQSQLLKDQQFSLLPRSTLLAVEAVRRFPSLETDQVLRSNLALLPQSVTNMTHGGNVRVEDVVFSPNGKYLATASQDKTARVWDLTNGKEVFRFKREGWMPNPNIAFSSNGKFLAMGTANEKSEDDFVRVRVLDITSGQEVASIKHDSSVYIVSFSPDSRYLVTTSGTAGGALVTKDSVMLITEIPSGREIARVKSERIIYQIAFSPDSKYLATTDKNAQVWELSSGKELMRLAPEKVVRAIAFSPDGKYLATSNRDDGIVELWQFVGGGANRFASKDNLLTVSPNFKYLAEIDDKSNTVRILNVNSREEIVLLKFQHNLQDFYFSNDAKYFVTTDEDKIIRIWEIANDKEVARLEHEVESEEYSTILSPDNKYLASREDNTIRLWEIINNRDSFSLKLKHKVKSEFSSAFASISFSPDGEYLANLSVSVAQVWKVASGKEIARVEHRGESQEEYHGAGYSYQHVFFSPDSEYIATAVSFSGEVIVWRVNNGKEVARLKHNEAFFGGVFSPDNKYLATAGYDGIARIWNMLVVKKFIK